MTRKRLGIFHHRDGRTSPIELQDCCRDMRPPLWLPLFWALALALAPALAYWLL